MRHLTALVLLVAFASPATAGQCDTPPYGDTQASYAAFIETFGRLLNNPSGVMAAICRQKFEGVDRTPLYRLGFTDAVIASKSTAALAIDVLDAVRKLK